jgi:hypothetical protein
MINNILLQHPIVVMELPNWDLIPAGVIFGPLLLHGGSTGNLL